MIPHSATLYFVSNIRTRFKIRFWACPSLRSGRAAAGFAELRLASQSAARPPLRGALRIPHAGGGQPFRASRQNPFTSTNFSTQNGITLPLFPSP